MKPHQDVDIPLLQTNLEVCIGLLWAIDQTLDVHGHIDADTDLHRRIESCLASVDRKGGGI